MFASKTFFALLSVSLVAFAAPVSLSRREVPQEHSHEQFLTAVKASLNINNPAGIVDPVFGLLGAGAARQGAGTIADPDCLQQATADQAFTNAKAAGDVDGQVSALIFRALERNTLGVGLLSPACTSIKAVNPEIAAISQHQDPASPNAAAVNKAITLELAKQIAAVGGDPLDALKSGTFAPGNLNDPTARGNSCNTLGDAAGCIFTQNLLVEDATAAEIAAAVGGAATPPAAEPPAATTAPTATEAPAATVTDAPPAASAPASICAAPQTVTVTVQPTAAAPAVTGAPAAAPTAPAVAGNLQKFTGALGGAAAPTVTAGGRGFNVQGSDSFLNIGAAIGRSCDIQKNKCANISNAGGAAFSVGDCDAQGAQCRSANA